MARKSKQQSVYERIEDKKQEIKELETLLELRNNELTLLYQEKDDLEMRQLFEQMKNNGLSIEKAIELISSNK